MRAHLLVGLLVWLRMAQIVQPSFQRTWTCWDWYHESINLVTPMGRSLAMSFSRQCALQKPYAKQGIYLHELGRGPCCILAGEIRGWQSSTTDKGKWSERLAPECKATTFSTHAGRGLSAEKRKWSTQERAIPLSLSKTGQRGRENPCPPGQ